MAKGMYTNSELVETLIVDLNNLTKELASGQYIQFCTIVSRMGQKLINLRKNIDADLESKNKTIEQLKNQLRNLGQDIEDFTAEEFVGKLKEINKPVDSGA